MNAGVPTRVGKYRVDHVIGRGAIGVVYRGHDEQIDRPLAIKTLRPEVIRDLSQTEGVLIRFATEARSAGRCLHPNIVTVFDYVEQDGAPYIIMEFVDAGTLEAVIRSGTLLPIRQVGEIMAQLLFALDHAHSKTIIHRDVKPANILCPSAASIKVADFGVAHLDTLELTRASGLGAVGTPNYMAPERFQGRPADPRTDLFSAGVVLFQLLTGTKPFIATDIAELMQKVMNNPPPAIPTFRPELAIGIDAVVKKALARNPDERFQTAGAFIDALNSAVESCSHEHHPPFDLTKISRMKAPHSDGDTEATMNQTMASKLAPDTIDSIGQSLAHSLGPIAPHLVRRACEQTTNIEMLMTTLTRQIRSQAEIVRFRTSVESVLGPGRTIDPTPRTTISPADITAAADALKPLIGPMARVLAAREAKVSTGRDDFHHKLAEAVPNDRDRAKFLASLPPTKPSGH